VYFTDPDGAALVGREHTVSLFNRERVMRLGAPVWFRAPVVQRRGRHRLRVDTITPVAMSREGARIAVLKPTALTMQAALKAVAQRIGLDLYPELMFEDVGGELSSTHVPVGGHWQRGTAKPGTIVAWEGALRLTCNAPARWLLHVAERTGLGGCTSIGLGRIRVTEEST
jgi:hypothetical protein